MNKNFSRVTLLMASLLMAAPSLAAPPKTSPTSPITSEAARTMAANAERAARAHGYAIVISIVDSHGNLKHFHRMDGTSSGSIQVAQLKASTSARFPLSSSSLADRSASLPAIPTRPCQASPCWAAVCRSSTATASISVASASAAQRQSWTRSLPRQRWMAMPELTHKKTQGSCPGFLVLLDA